MIQVCVCVCVCVRVCFIQGKKRCCTSTLGRSGSRKAAEGLLCVVHVHQVERRLAVWCSGNALVSINAVALHQARLVLGWVTAFGQVNCLIT